MILALLLVLLFENAYIAAIFFLITALLWFFFYPVWEKQRYTNHYKKSIRENLYDRIGKRGTIEIDNDTILAKDTGSESRTLTTEIEAIYEISATIFIRIKGGQSFVIPKNKITNLDEVTNGLKELASYLNINYEINEKWRWK